MDARITQTTSEPNGLTDAPAYMYGQCSHLTTRVTAAVSREATGTATATGARRGASPHVSRRPSQERPPAQQSRPEPVAAPLLPFPLLPAALAASTLVAEVQEGAGGLEQVVKTVHNAYTPPTQPCGDWGNFMYFSTAVCPGSPGGAAAAARTPADDRVGCFNFLIKRDSKIK